MMDRIPPRFQRATFDNFRTHTASQKAAKDAVAAWIRAIPQGPMLALIGATGTGKSHLFYSAARFLIAELDAMDPKMRTATRRTYPLVVPWYSLADELRYGRTVQTEGGSRSQDAHEVREQLWGRQVVMLDEVRKTSGSEFDDTELAKFACHAYDNQVAVLVTTNWSPLSDVMGPAAASRFAQVVIDGPDGRQESAA